MRKNKALQAIVYSLLVVLIIMLQILIGESMKDSQKVREPAVAGTFYQSSGQVLRSQLDAFFKQADINYSGEKVRALIVPHAGYIYSGQTAMYGYKKLYMDLLLREEDSFKVFILAPNHTEYVSGVVIPDYDYFRTPLGDVKVNSTKVNAKISNSAHKEEHAIEVQLPFLQYVFEKAGKEFTIIPIIVGEINDKQASEIARAIQKEMDENVIIIVSSDLSHYKPQKEAEETDYKTIHKILDNDLTAPLDACGRYPIAVLEELSKLNSWEKPELLLYSTSGDVTMDKRAVVGYAAISFPEKAEHLLIRLARRAIQNSFDSRTDNFRDLEQAIPKEYLEKKGTFVTLTINGRLRGCIGNIIGTKSIFDGVISNSRFAAFQDPRFDGLTEKEFEKIDIEVSILSKPEDCTLEKIKKGDGVIIRQGLASAVYLPQVWEQLPEKESFLGSLCEKAGLEWNCYKEKATKVQRFEVKIIK